VISSRAWRAQRTLSSGRPKRRSAQLASNCASWAVDFARVGLTHVRERWPPRLRRPSIVPTISGMWAMLQYDRNPKSALAHTLKLPLCQWIVTQFRQASEKLYCYSMLRLIHCFWPRLSVAPSAWVRPASERRRAAIIADSRWSRARYALTEMQEPRPSPGLNVASDTIGRVAD
jgi:hypothetical protein